jgi:hypothetical protein
VPSILLLNHSMIKVHQPSCLFCDSSFYLFTCLIISSGKHKRTYLDFEEAQKLFETAGIFCVQPLFVGTYEKCLDFNIQFQSTIPKRLGLPPIANNKAEVRPAHLHVLMLSETRILIEYMA